MMGMLASLVLTILGILLLLFWVIGTWMNSTPYLVAGITCICAGVFVAWRKW